VRHRDALVVAAEEGEEDAREVFLSTSVSVPMKPKSSAMYLEPGAQDVAGCMSREEAVAEPW